MRTNFKTRGLYDTGAKPVEVAQIVAIMAALLLVIACIPMLADAIGLEEAVARVGN